jgi:hypothetical protein
VRLTTRSRIVGTDLARFPEAPLWITPVLSPSIHNETVGQFDVQ